MPAEVSFQTVLDALADESRSFPKRHLARFSDLEPGELKALALLWPRLSLRRKLRLLQDLQQLAERDMLVSFENLGRALLKDPDAPVRIQAIRLLWECEDPKLVPAYLEILASDEQDEARAAAATILGQYVYLGEIEKIPPQVLRRVEDELLAAARSDPKVSVQRRALEALGASSRDEVPVLIDSAYHRRDPDWVASALFAMGRSSDSRWEKQVVSKLHSPNQSIRAEAAQAAGELGLRSARAALLDLLADEENLDIRRAIVWSLSQIGGEGVRDRLEELLEAEYDDDESAFLEEALDNLAFTEDMGSFDMFDFEANEDADRTL